MTQILLVRHGQASFGAGNYDVLSPMGERQAVIAGEHFRKLGLRFDAVVSGSLQRQRHTAELAGFATPTIDEDFNEYPFESILKAYLPVVGRRQPELGIADGSFQTDRRRFQVAFEAALGLWLEAAEHDSKTPIEEWKSFQARVVAGLERLTLPGREQIVVFTSGGVIAVALQAALGISDATTFALNWRIANASLHRLKRNRQGLTALGYNDIAHLELQGREVVTYR